MGELKNRTPSKSKSQSHHNRRKMASPSPAISNLTALLQRASTGSATFLRCPSESLRRLRGLNEAEWVTLFTPVVPHPPATVLPRDMDPFEPLGRSFTSKVRHVPYQSAYGMTETHSNFLPSAGAIVTVVCTTENVLNYNPQAFEEQARFAYEVQAKVSEDDSLANVPVIVLLITNGEARQRHEEGLQDFRALVTCNNYTTSALANAVKVMFGM